MLGLASIRALGWIEKYEALYHKHLDNSIRPDYLLDMIQQWLNLALNLIVAVIAVSLTCLSTQLALSLRAGFVGAGLVSLMTFGELVCAIIRSWIQLETSLGAVRRLREFEAAAGSEDCSSEDLQPPEDWPKGGAIRIDGASASYIDDSVSENEQLALKNISMSIKAGEKVAIVGRTGR